MTIIEFLQAAIADYKEAVKVTEWLDVPRQCMSGLCYWTWSKYDDKVTLEILFPEEDFHYRKFRWESPYMFNELQEPFAPALQIRLNWLEEKLKEELQKT